MAIRPKSGSPGVDMRCDSSWICHVGFAGRGPSTVFEGDDAVLHSILMPTALITWLRVSACERMNAANSSGLRLPDG